MLLFRLGSVLWDAEVDGSGLSSRSLFRSDFFFSRFFSFSSLLLTVGTNMTDVLEGPLSPMNVTVLVLVLTVEELPPEEFTPFATDRSSSLLTRRLDFSLDFSSYDFHCFPYYYFLA
jgi:hypothetical protein